ncbi:MAG: DUF1320 domain-containing protein [Dehalococcoidia bacterium]|nr:MAG: DUF1320 domain-containing protein [Dehalococcoidia bacterium]
MAYSVAADVLALHKKLENTNTTVITGHITDVDNEIDMRLKNAGYDVPFATTPPIVAIISKYEACYRVLKYEYGSQVQDGTYEWIDKYHDMADGLLKRLEAGENLLDSSGTVVSGPGDMVKSSTQDFGFIFDLGDIVAQSYEPDDSDIRYGD